MIALKESFDTFLQERDLGWLVMAPAETFLPQSAVEALAMRLLVFLVRACDAVAVTKQPRA